MDIVGSILQKLLCERLGSNVTVLLLNPQRWHLPGSRKSSFSEEMEESLLGLGSWFVVTATKRELAFASSSVPGA